MATIEACMMAAANCKDHDGGRRHPRSVYCIDERNDDVAAFDLSAGTRGGRCSLCSTQNATAGQSLGEADKRFMMREGLTSARDKSVVVLH